MFRKFLSCLESIKNYPLQGLFLNICSDHVLDLRNYKKTLKFRLFKTTYSVFRKKRESSYTHILINSGILNYDHTPSCVT